MKYNKSIYTDSIGIISSTLCLVHCIATPLLIALGFGYFSTPFITYIFLIIAFIAIYKTTKNNKHIKNSSFLWTSFWGFVFSNLLKEEFEFLHYFEYFFGFLIIIGHINNIRICKKCNTE